MTVKRTKIRRIIMGIVAISVIILVVIAACSIMRPVSTDLSGIAVDGIKIGSDITNFDLSVYENSNRFSNRGGDYDYHFDRLVLDADDNSKVTYIFGYNSEVSVDLNGQSASTIEEVISILGDNYSDETEDREQRLRKYVYFDDTLGAKAEFIFSEQARTFVWIVLQYEK